MEKMNIIDILRDCPEGTKLYSLVHGEVELTRVGVEDIYCKPDYLNHELSFNSDGRWVENLGECILFPSKENRNWSTFKRPFKDGDIIYNPGIKATAIFYKQTNDHTISHCFLSILGEFKIHHYHCKSLFDWRFASEEEKEILFKTIEDNGYRWNPETKTLDSKFKDGDVVFYSNTIAIFKEWGDETLFRTYCTFYTTVSNPTYQFEISRPLFGKGIRKEARFATLEEKEKFFEVIRDNGYEWDPQTKTLKKLPKFKVGDRIKHKDSGIYCNFGEYIESLKGYRTNIGLLIRCDDIDDWELYPLPDKFDINTLKPFDKVLVRTKGFTPAWTIAFYDGYNPDRGGCFTPFCVTNGEYFQQCIPYEGNEHLRGTTDDCDGFYKNWE